jgi:hypothetical protein
MTSISTTLTRTQAPHDDVLEIVGATISSRDQ